MEWQPLQAEDEEGEADELVNSVLDEIGIDLNGARLKAETTQHSLQRWEQCGLWCQFETIFLLYWKACRKLVVHAVPVSYPVPLGSTQMG